MKRKSLSPEHVLWSLIVIFLTVFARYLAEAAAKRVIEEASQKLLTPPR